MQANEHKIKIYSELEMYKIELEKLRSVFLLKLPTMVTFKLSTLNDRVDAAEHNHRTEASNLQEQLGAQNEYIE